MTSKPGTPASASVGTSGASAVRLAEVVPSRRALPARAWLAMDGCENMKLISPVITAISDWGAPL